MKKFSALFLRFTEDQRKALNAGGWSSDLGQAYLNAKDPLDGPPNYLGAIKHDLIEHAADLSVIEMEGTVGPDQVWVMLQNAHRGWGVDPPKGIEVFTDFPRSMDVGDIVYSHEENKYYRIQSLGHAEITDQTVIDFLDGKLV